MIWFQWNVFLSINYQNVSWMISFLSQSFDTYASPQPSSYTQTLSNQILRLDCWIWAHIRYACWPTQVPWLQMKTQLPSIESLMFHWSILVVRMKFPLNYRTTPWVMICDWQDSLWQIIGCFQNDYWKLSFICDLKLLHSHYNRGNSEVVNFVQSTGLAPNKS